MYICLGLKESLALRLQQERYHIARIPMVLICSYQSFSASYPEVMCAGSKCTAAEHLAQYRCGACWLSGHSEGIHPFAFRLVVNT